MIMDNDNASFSGFSKVQLNKWHIFGVARIYNIVLKHSEKNEIERNQQDLNQGLLAANLAMCATTSHTTF